jgi:hypothetical protein
MMERPIANQSLKRISLTIVLVVSGAVLSRVHFSTLSAQVAIQPFYLEQLTSGVSPETGVFHPSSMKTVARRSDGVTVVVEERGPAFALKIRQILSPDGKAVTVWENVMLETTWPGQSDGGARDLGRQLETASADCWSKILVSDGDGPAEPFEKFIRMDTSFGQPVAVLQIENSGRVITSWKAPSLACESLFDSSERVMADGSLKLMSETTTTNLKLGEPDPGLFTVGGDYVESKPSVGLAETVRRVLGDSPLFSKAEPEFRKEGEMLDRRYQGQPRPKR